jgi:hypothetical protein
VIGANEDELGRASFVPPLVQNPSINGYSGAFDYNLSNGVTIVVEATKSETATTDAAAFDILCEVIKYLTPATPLNF